MAHSLSRGVVITIVLILTSLSSSFRLKTCKTGRSFSYLGSTSSEPSSSSASTKDAISSTFKKTFLVGVATLVSSRRACFANDLMNLPECSDAITVFKSNAGKEVILIGTAHISEKSVDLVRNVIRKVKPEVVMIELDAKRLGRVGGDKTLAELGFDIPKGSPTPVPELLRGSVPLRPPSIFSNALNGFKLQVSGWAQQQSGALLGKALGSFYKNVEKLGFVAGGEFKAAVEEGQKIGARILLGDRDVDITLQRLSLAITATKPEQFQVPLSLSPFLSLSLSLFLSLRLSRIVYQLLSSKKAYSSRTTNSLTKKN